MKTDRGNRRKFCIRLESPPSVLPAGRRWRATVRDLSAGTERVCEGALPVRSRWECALNGAVDLLASTPEGCAVTFFGPGRPIVRGMRSWAAAWANSGWLTRRGTPVRCGELWRRLSALAAKRTVIWWPIELPVSAP